MKQKFIFLMLVLVFCCAPSTAASGESDASTTQSGSLIAPKGSFNADLRYRIEDVSQDDLAKSSFASTLRTRLEYKIKFDSSFGFHVGVDDVRSIGNADYTTPSLGALATDIGPKNVGYPVIADPLETELNQLHASYSTKSTKITVGRQRIIRANSRFIGNVGWRQREQTFDAVSIENDLTANWNVFAAYIDRRNTITFTDVNHQTLLFDAAYKGLPLGVISGYYYDIKDAESDATLNIIGLRLTGAKERANYTIEWAHQSNKENESPTYLLLEGGLNLPGVILTLGFEKLGSANTTSFATPLATLHKFNGWADQFLVTPNQGLEDRYVKLSGKLGEVQLTAVYHDFESDKRALAYGSEIDMSAETKLTDTYSIGLKLADFSSDSESSTKSDVRKAWIWAEAHF